MLIFFYLEKSRFNMESFFTAFAILLLAVSVDSQEMSYEQLLSQLHACPKECYCPPSFPNAVYCSNKGLKKIPNIPPFTWYLYLQNNLIDVLSADAFHNATQLKWVNLNQNKISDKGMEKNALQALTNLLYLHMDENLLTSIPSPLPPNLEQLHLSKNQISKIPASVFSGNKNLMLLNLHSNKLQDDTVTEVNLKGLSGLIQINLAKNQLNSMPKGLPPSVMQLYLDGNNIQKIPAGYFNGLQKITFLRLNHNKITNGGIPKNVFNISSILDLQLSYNQLTVIPQISSGLQHLHLDHNKIKSMNTSDICPVSTDTFDDYFDERVPQLRYLRLDGNEIKPPIPRDIMICFRHLSAVVI
ncbi:keratocan isoform 2-T2 [Clarias gariepinus]